MLTSVYELPIARSNRYAGEQDAATATQRMRRSESAQEPEAARGLDDRQEQVVGDHRGHGHRLDDDHAGRRREAAEEDEQAEPHAARAHRQAQHERVGLADGQPDDQAAVAMGMTKRLMRSR